MAGFREWAEQAYTQNPEITDREVADSYRQQFGYGPGEDDFQDWAEGTRPLYGEVAPTDDYLRSQFEYNYGPIQEQNSWWGSDAVDQLQIGLARGVPQAVAGLADIALSPFTGQTYAKDATEWALDKAGFGKDWEAEQRAGMSPEYHASKQNQDAAWDQGVLDYAGALVTNPRATVGAIFESLPSIYAGGLLGRAATAAKATQAARPLAPYIGEGAFMAGASMNQLTEAGVDPRTAALLSTGVGVGGGLIGAGGGKLANRLGVDNIDLLGSGVSQATRAAQRAPGDRAVKEYLRRVGVGGLIEGFAEEMPQSMLEQAALNIGTGENVGDHIFHAGLQGAAAGLGMGVGFNALHNASLLGKEPAPPAPATPTPTPTASPAQASVQAPPDFSAVTDPAEAQQLMDALFDSERGLTPEQRQRKIDAEMSGQPFTFTQEELDQRWNALLQGREQDRAEQAGRLSSLAKDPKQGLVGVHGEKSLFAKPGLLDDYVTKYLNGTMGRQKVNKDGTPAVNKKGEPVLRAPEVLALFDWIDQTEGKSFDRTVAPTQPAPTPAPTQGLSPTQPAPTPAPTQPTQGLSASQPAPAQPAPTPAPTQGLSASQPADLLTPTPAETPPPPVVEAPAPKPKKPSKLAQSQQELLDWTDALVARNALTNPNDIEAMRRPFGSQASKLVKYRDSLDELSDEQILADWKKFEHGPSTAGAAKAVMLKQEAALRGLTLPTPTVAAAETPAETPAPAAIDPNTLETVEAVDAEIARIVSELPDDQKLLVTRVLQDGGTQASVAKELDVSASKVSKDKKLVIAQLAEKLKGLNARRLELSSATSEVGGLNPEHITALEATKAAEEDVGFDPEPADPSEKKKRPTEDEKLSFANTAEREAAQEASQLSLGAGLQAQLSPDRVQKVRDDLKVRVTKLLGGAYREKETWSDWVDRFGGLSKIIDKLQNLDPAKAPPTEVAPLVANLQEQIAYKGGGAVSVGAETPLSEAILWEIAEKLRSGVSDNPFVMPIARAKVQADRLMVEGYRGGDKRKDDNTIVLLESFQKRFKAGEDRETLAQELLDLAVGFGEQNQRKEAADPDAARRKQEAEERARKEVARLMGDADIRAAVERAFSGAVVQPKVRWDELTASEQLGLFETAGEYITPKTPLPQALVSALLAHKLAARIQQGNDAPVANPTTREAFQQAVRRLLGVSKHIRLHLYETPEEAPQDVLRGVDTAPYGWVQQGENGLEAHFILSQVEQGTELGKLLHELGAHIGLESILPSALYANLVNRIKGWAEAGNGLDSRIARAAQERVRQANTPEESQDAELIAYFLEEAVRAGLNPTGANVQGALGNLLRRVWAAFKTALRKLRIHNVARLTPQDIVDLAYGAARVELTGVWHGAAANFRRFDDAYNGTGEGTNWQGVGTYFADRPELAEAYRHADSVRKGDEMAGLVHQAALLATPDEMMHWSKPLALHAEPVRAALQQALGKAYNPLLTGRALYRELVSRAYKRMGIDKPASQLTRDDLGSEAAARVSAYLDGLGIKGMQHYDDLSSLEVAQAKRVADATPAELNLPDSFTLESGETFQPTSVFEWDGEMYATGAIDGVVSPETFPLNDLLTEEQQLEAATKLAEVLYASVPEGLTNNTVVFNDENIVNVARYPGGNFADPKFGFNPSESAKKALSQLADPASGILSRVGTVLKQGITKGVYGLTFTENLLRRAEQKYDDMRQPVHNLRKALQEASSLSKQVEQEASAVVHKFERLDKDTKEKIEEYLDWARENKAWGYDPSAWLATPVQINPEAKNRFDALVQHNPVAGEIVEAVNRLSEQRLQQKQRLIEDRATRFYDKLIAEATKQSRKDKLEATKQELLKHVKKLRRENAPYVPWARFGDFVVTGVSPEFQEASERNDKAKLSELRKDGKHYVMHLAETRYQALKLKDELEANGMIGDFWHSAVWRDKPLVGFPELAKLRTFTKQHYGDSKQGNALVSAIEELTLHTLSAQHALQSNRPAENIAGHDKHVMRGFASQSRSDAHYIAQLATADQFEESLKDLDAFARSSDTGTRAERTDLVNEIRLQMEKNAKYVPLKWIDRLAATSSTYHLLTSPAYFIQNALQVTMMTAPKLAGDVGIGIATRELIRAYKDMAPMLRDAGVWGHLDLTKLNISQDEQIALEKLQQRGVIDIFMDLDLGSFAGSGSGAMSKTGRLLDDTLRRLPAKIETINRVVTALAAHRAASKNSRVGDPVQYAYDLVYDTHGDYSGWNTPRLISPQTFQSAKLLFQFRKFQLIQIGFFAGLARKALKDADPDTKSAARRALGYTFGMYGLMGGALGLPAMGAAQTLVSLLLGGGDDDEPLTKDAQEMRFREWAKSAGMEPGWTDLILRGTGSLVGVNLTDKVGAQHMMSLLPFVEFDPAEYGNFEKVVTASLGPSAAMAGSMYRGVGHILQGDWLRGAERMLPSGFSKLTRAARLQMDGETTYNGDQVLSPEEVSMATQFWGSLGFNSSQLTSRWVRTRLLKDYEDAYQTRTARIKRQYGEAVRSRDRRAMADLRREWVELQSLKRKGGFRVAPLSELIRAPMEKAKRERKVATGVKYDAGNQRFVRQTAELWGS